MVFRSCVAWIWSMPSVALPSVSLMNWYDGHWCTLSSIVTKGRYHWSFIPFKPPAAFPMRGQHFRGHPFIVDPFKKTSVQKVDFPWLCLVKCEITRYTARRFLPHFLPSEPSAGRALWWGAVGIWDGQGSLVFAGAFEHLWHKASSIRERQASGISDIQKHDFNIYKHIYI